MKAKIFVSGQAFTTLEKQINDWLASAPGMKVTSTQLAAAPASQNTHAQIICLVLYEEAAKPAGALAQAKATPGKGGRK